MRKLGICFFIIVVLLFIARICVVDVVSVPDGGSCPHAGSMSLVNRWAYGYRLPWKATSRISYRTGKKDEWVAYNRPALSRDEKSDTASVCIGRLTAVPGDTLWYNNDSGSISTHKDSKHGFVHPLIVPGRGKKVTVTNDNIRFYAITIMRHEPVKADIIDGTLCVSGKMVKQYTFQQDYYWIVADNPKNTNDSRSFGFVPQASLIGKLL